MCVSCLCFWLVVVIRISPLHNSNSLQVWCWYGCHEWGMTEIGYCTKFEFESADGRTSEADGGINAKTECYVCHQQQQRAPNQSTQNGKFRTGIKKLQFLCHAQYQFLQCKPTHFSVLWCESFHQNWNSNFKKTSGDLQLCNLELELLMHTYHVASKFDFGVGRCFLFGWHGRFVSPKMKQGKRNSTPTCIGNEKDKKWVDGATRFTIISVDINANEITSTQAERHMTSQIHDVCIYVCAHKHKHAYAAATSSKPERIHTSWAQKL